MSIFLAIIIGGIYIFYSVYSDGIARGGDPLYSVISETVLWIIFYILFVGVWKAYCVEWKRLTDRKLLRGLCERVWFPLVTVFLVTSTDYYVKFDGISFSLLLGFALFLSLVDVGASIERFVVNKFLNLNPINQTILYSQYPPKCRSDLLPMDLIVNIMTAIMTIKKIT